MIHGSRPDARIPDPPAGVQPSENTRAHPKPVLSVPLGRCLGRLRQTVEVLRGSRIVVLWIAYALVAVLVASASASIVRSSVIDDPSPVLDEESLGSTSPGGPSVLAVASSTSPAAPVTPAAPRTGPPGTSEPPAPAQSSAPGPLPAVSRPASPTPRSTAPAANRTPRATGTPTPAASSAPTPAPTATPTVPPKPKPRPKLRYRYFPTAGGIVLASCRGAVLRVRATPAFRWGISKIDRSRSRVLTRFLRNDGLREITVLVRCVNLRPVARIRITNVTSVGPVTPVSRPRPA